MSVERVAVITGGASGIGRGCAELFAARGCGVVVVDVPTADVSWLPADGSIISVVGDVSSDDTNAAMVQAALEHFGRLDVAVLNAGVVGGPGFEEEGALERLDRVLAVNVRGVAAGIRHAVPAMRTTGSAPAIVATASTSGFGGDPHNFAYNASKAAVMNLVRAAAIDYGCEGIRVNAIAPGPVETGMTTRLKQAPEVYHAMERRIALQRWGQPSELAEAVWFLSSPAASFITGAVLPVDGGLSAQAGHWNLPERVTG
jgi:short-subunit dehydrogenase